MIHTQIRTGRLVEIRFTVPVTLPEFVESMPHFRQLVAGAPGLVVSAADLRDAEMLPADVREALLGLLRADNPRVERGAMLVSDGFLFGRQVERLVQDAENPRRRVFRDAESMRAWLDEVLSPEERTRLSAFLARAAA